MPGRLVRDLRPVVRILPGVVDDGRHDLAVRRRVAPQLVCHHPEIVPLPLDVHEELIQVPDVSQPPLFVPEFPGVVWTEFLTPLPDGLVGDDHSSLCQQFLDVPEAQSESMLEPDGVTDDVRGIPVSVVAALIGFHQPSLLGTSSS